MEAFTVWKGKLAFIDRANVDTDQIIPKQFLKSIERTGFGEALFFDWRYLPDGRPDPAFVLNQAPYEEATILVARNNFGCGSSREHAVWAVLQAGFRAVIAPRKEQAGNRVPAFADIFAGNAVKNGLLTVELAEGEVEALFRADREKAAAGGSEGVEAEIDLASQTVKVDGAGTYRFEIDAAVKEHLLAGLDDIALTLKREESIAAYEKRREFWQVPARK